VNYKPTFRVLLLLSAAVSQPAFAQTLPDAGPAAPQSDSADIVVTGARLQAKKEIEAKREIAVISDSIGSDEIGTLPDFGLGEALTRVPGVSTVQNNARGEAQFVSIRGLNADYNLVQIDGVSLPANETGRRTVSLDVIPSSLASRVETYKSVNAGMNGNAIGGIVNLRTRSAFDGKGNTFIGGRFDIGHWDFERTRGDRKPSGQAEVVASTTFGPDRKVGVVVAGSYFRRDSASLSSASDNYLYFDPATGARLNPLTTDVGTADVAPDRRRWLHYDNVRQRYGVFGKLEFDDHVGFRAALTLAAFDHLNDEERQSNLVTQNGNPVATTITATSGRIASAWAQADLVNYGQKRGMRYADLRGHWTPSDTIDGDLGINYAVATYRQDARLATYRIANTTNLAYTYDLVPGQFVHFDFANPAYVADAANYKQFEYGTNRDDQRETALTAQGNLRVNMATQDRGFGVAGGVWARFLDRRYDFQVDNYRNPTTGLGSSYLLSSVLAPESYTPYNGRGKTMLFVDPDAARAFFDANRAGFAANSSSNAAGRVQSDYDLTEDVKAGYVMARYAIDRARLTAGVRYEDTNLSTGSNALRSNVYTYGRNGQSYRDWLPSAQFDWDVTDRFRLRAAYSRTLGRPNYDDLAARETVSVNTLTDAISITGGNPTLKPRRSRNVDLSLEYYASRDVLFAVAGFAKTIDDEIITIRNQATEFFDGRDQLVTRIRPANAGRTTVKGVELNAVVTRMAFLPQPLDGLGFAANLTLLDPTPPRVALSDNITLRRLSGLFESADTVANVRAFYTLGPATVQGAWNHLSTILYSISTSDPLQDRRYAPSDTFDAQLRLTLSRRFTVVAQGKNLSNARPRRMTGNGFDYLREEIDNGRAFYIGALLRY
jgi:TonB-dependent receptor